MIYNCMSAVKQPNGKRGNKMKDISLTVLTAVTVTNCHHWSLVDQMCLNGSIPLTWVTGFVSESMGFFSCNIASFVIMSCNYSVSFIDHVLQMLSVVFSGQSSLDDGVVM